MAWLLISGDFSFILNMAEENIDRKSEDLFPQEEFKEMVEAGVFYGRRKSKTYPKMKPYVLTNRGGIEIINLEKTLDGLKKILEFVEVKVRAGGLLLLVGTQPPAFQGITELAKKYNYPFVINRWLGGTITNFKVIMSRVEYLKKLRNDAKSGALDKYTKKEKAQFEAEINRLEELLGGLENLTRLPDVMVVIDSNLHTTAVREAKRAKIPVVAFANVDSDPEMLDYYIVGNNKSKKSVTWFLSKLDLAIEEAKKASAVLAVEIKTKEEDKVAIATDKT